jgi:hypothetical protein
MGSEPRPRKPLMPLAGPQPSAPPLQLTDGAATAAAPAAATAHGGGAPAAPAAHGRGAGGMTPRAPGSVSVSPGTSAEMRRRSAVRILYDSCCINCMSTVSNRKF